jgi:hypothetical protein
MRAAALLVLLPVFAWAQGGRATKERESKSMYIPEETRTVAPALDKYAQGPIAELWKRPGLTPRDPASLPCRL